MDKNTKYIIGGLGLILAIFVIFYFVTRQGTSLNSPSTSTSTNQTSTFTSSSTTTSTARSTSTTSTPRKTTTTRPRSTRTSNTPISPAYADALNTYKKSGYYIQFYPCQATPGTMIVKKGSKIMLDNRDTTTHIIGIMKTLYTIQAYNFKIATLSTLGVNYVTCDGGGSAAITVVP